MIGSALGHYTISNHLGSGGMGDVYQATDARLGRDVAVKFVPEAFIDDSSRLARFQREARTLAAVSHPHIAAVYGFEQIAGRHFIVMELVRGATLSTRLSGGALAIEDVIRYGTQIADALAAAHARGIVHRDLKPGNIMVTKSGIKVLDFGLAKSNDEDETLTRTEAVIGTPAYMAPEQREGGQCDARSDIYSFGLILLEMATGRRDAEGDSLKRVSAPLARVIQGCLERDPDARWQSAADISRALTWVTAPGDGKEQSTSRLMAWVAAASIAGIIVGAASAWFLRPEPVKADPPLEFIDLPSGTTALTISGWGSDLALTPDGLRYVYVGNNGTELFVRARGRVQPESIAKGTNIRRPFVTPDGQRVGYFDNERFLKLVSIKGGPSVSLPIQGKAGGTWLDNNRIVVGPQNAGGPLRLVDADTGLAVELTTVDKLAGEVVHDQPHALPGGRTVVFTILTKEDKGLVSKLAVLDTETRQRHYIKNLLGTNPRYVPAPRGTAGGYLAYIAEGALWTIPFDLEQLQTKGQSTRASQRPVTDRYGYGEFATDAAGTLVHVDGPASSGDGIVQSIVSLDWASGREMPVAPARPYLQARISPDETKIALIVRTNDGVRIEILDVQRQVSTPLRLDPVAVLSDPVWLDGKRIVFNGVTPEYTASGMWAVAVDGTGKPERLLMSGNQQTPTSVLPGRLVFHEATTNSSFDILEMTLDSSRVTPLLHTTDWESGGVVSPDGQWIAYECCREGQPEIWVSPYPKTEEAKWQVSTGGGQRAAWSRDQLFFVTPSGNVMRVPIESRGSAWVPSKPVPVSATSFGNSRFDISRDGGRLLMIKPVDSRPPHIKFVQDWVAELGRGAQ